MTVKDDVHHLVDGLVEKSRRAAENAEIDAEYERAYREHPISEVERRVLDAFTRISVRALYREPGSRG